VSFKRSGQAPSVGRRSIIRYAAAVCITVAIAAGTAIYCAKAGKAQQLTCNTVTGENLKAKDIILITGDEINSFSNDIKVKIDGNGTAIVSEAGARESKIVETRKTEMNTFIAPYGKRVHIKLTDGTKVWLNSGSALELLRINLNTKHVKDYGTALFIPSSGKDERGRTD
jgi:ferric-dicitrate binding protein FerR (iron transport regulator)